MPDFPIIDLDIDDADRVSFTLKELKEVVNTFEDVVGDDERLALGEWIESLREAARHIA
jgi:hypothetical protein